MPTHPWSEIKHKSDIPFHDALYETDDYEQVDIDLAEREAEREAAWRTSHTEFDPTTAGKVVNAAVNQPVVEEDRGFRSLQKECYQIAEDHGFHNVGQTFGDKLMLLVTEAAEAMEAFREGHALDEVWYEKNGTKPCGIGSELADIFIRLVDTAEDAGIDLVTHVVEKMNYNRTRSYLHGKLL